MKRLPIFGWRIERGAMAAGGTAEARPMDTERAIDYLIPGPDDGDGGEAPPEPLSIHLTVHCDDPDRVAKEVVTALRSKVILDQLR